MPNDQALPSRVFKVVSQANHKLAAIAQAPITPQEIPDMGFSYAQAEPLVAGLSFARGHIPPKGEVPAHAGPNPYALYILSGTGTLTLTDANGATQDQINYAPNDLIMFEAGAMHGWINSGDTAMEWFGVDIEPNQDNS